jgi:lysophospholipase L1-like esterase
VRPSHPFRQDRDAHARARHVQDGFGQRQAVYIQYSKNAGTAPADTRPDVAPIPKICTTGKLRCLTINTTDLIGPMDTVDGIHPTLAGCDRIAKRVLEEMEKAGVRR